MDSRFKNIESELNYQFSPEFMEDAFNALDHYDLDQAFIDASNAEKANYSSLYWNNFKAAETSLMQDMTFSDAASNYSVPYDKSYWYEAEKALINEGLHFEYKEEYWNEAKALLAKEDRKAFFYRWSAIASILILAGFVGQSLYTNYNSGVPSVNDITENTVNGNRVIARTQPVFNLSALSQNSQLANVNENITSLPSNPTPPVINNGQQPSNSLSGNQTPGVSPRQVTSLNNSSETIENIPLREVIPNKRRITELIEAIKLPLFPIIQNERPLIALNEVSVPVDTYIPRNSYQIALHGQTGFGNSVNSDLNLGNRNALNIEFTVIPKKLRFLSFGVSSGIIHESLEGFEAGESFSRYDISGKVDHSGYQYTYDALIKFSSTLNAGFALNQKNKINVMLGYEKYLTSKIKLREYFGDVIKEQPEQWGVNDVFNVNDFNLRLGYERQLSPMLSLTLESKIGLRTKVNQYYFSELNNNRDMTALIGLKYKIFRY